MQTLQGNEEGNSAIQNSRGKVLPKTPYDGTQGRDTYTYAKIGNTQFLIIYFLNNFIVWSVPGSMLGTKNVAVSKKQSIYSKTLQPDWVRMEGKSRLNLTTYSLCIKIGTSKYYKI